MRAARILPGITLLIIALGAVRPVAAETVIAQWQPYQVEFRYHSFDTYYTCSGLEKVLAEVLLAIGARDDVRIDDNCFNGSSEIRINHHLLVAFALPVIADSATREEETFPAEWRSVTLRRNRPRDLDPGDCEFLQDFFEQILSQVPNRNIKKSIRCSRGNPNLNTMKLEATLLMPAELPGDAGLPGEAGTE